MTDTEVAELLGVTQPAVSKAVQRGERSVLEKASLLDRISKEDVLISGLFGLDFSDYLGLGWSVSFWMDRDAFLALW